MKPSKLSILLGVAAVLFSACTSLPNTQENYILTVKIYSTQTQQSISGQYGGQILSWQPERNIAILKTQKLPTPNDVAVLHLEENGAVKTTEGRLGLNQPDQLQTQGAATSGSLIGMSGWSTWSNSWSTWSSSWSTWSSSSTTLPPLPSSNTAAFQSIRLPQAHAIANKLGDGILVAVLDTGIDLAHPGFAGKLASSSQFWDYVGNDSNPSEEWGRGYGHGTAVAGLVVQVAPAAKILPIRVLDGNGEGDLDNLILALQRAVDAGAKVINVSLGALEYSAALDAMLQYAASKQVYVVAAAGNSTRTDSADYPARIAETSSIWNYLLSIGSVANSDALSSFTNRGYDVSFYAPGESLTTFYPNRAVINATGTSFSAPLVSGALALGLSQSSDPVVRADMGTLLRYYGLEQQSIWLTINGNGLTPWQHSYGRLDLEKFLLRLPNFVPSAPRAGRTDFVNNGSFETGNFNGWIISGSVALNPMLDYFSGDNSVSLGLPKTTLSQQLTGLRPNTTYVVSAWIRVIGSRSATFSVSNFGGTTVSRTIAANSTFQKISFEFTTGATNTTATLAFAKPLGTGTIVGDLFSVIAK